MPVIIKQRTHVCEIDKERARRTDRQGKTCVERQTHTHVEREVGGERET